MTRALVLGGAGFIGTAACKELMRRGVETIAAGRTDRPYGTFTSYVAFDRDDEPQLKRALESVQPDVVLDLAGDEPMQVEAMIRSFNGDRYVFVSSGVVYPDIAGRPAAEDDFVPLDGQPPPEPGKTPLTEYAITSPDYFQTMGITLFVRRRGWIIVTARIVRGHQQTASSVLSR